MMYKTCPMCGSNLDPGERCDCQKSPAAKTIRAAAYNEAYREEYAKHYMGFIDENLPPCVADDLAEMTAKKKAAAVANSTVNSYQAIKRRNRK